MRRVYGSSPLHLLAHLAALALAGWALLQILDARAATGIVVWLVASVVLHDALLWPLYTTLDRIALRALPLRAINHLRVPVALSALMFVAAFPAILEVREQNFTRVSGIGFEGHLERWLLVSGLLFTGSAVLYALGAGGRPPSARAAGPSPSASPAAGAAPGRSRWRRGRPGRGPGG